MTARLPREIQCVSVSNDTCARGGTFLVSMRYSSMMPPADQQKIADIEDLIARAEERIRKIQARAEPGTARMVHALTNRIRAYRRDLHKLLPRHADPTNQTDQLVQQQSQMQQALRDASADRSGELPAKQDQEPHKPAPKQGATAGQ